jgi:type I restriction enzyme, S subunit
MSLRGFDKLSPNGLEVAMNRAGCQTKALGEVCQIKPPKSEARNKIAADEMVSFLPMEALGIDRKYFQANQEKPLSKVVGSYTYFADGDVLLAKITPCFENGKLGIANGLTNGIGFGSSEYIVFRPDGTLNKEWLYYYLSREVFRVEGAARMLGSVGHKRVSKEFIENYPIPVPPLPEQQRIVSILDAAFDGIATAKTNAEQNLQNARALFESHLQSVFTQHGEGGLRKN